MNIRKKKSHLKMTELLMYLKYHTPTLLVDFCLLRGPEMKLEIFLKYNGSFTPLKRGGIYSVKNCYLLHNLLNF